MPIASPSSDQSGACTARSTASAARAARSAAGTSSAARYARARSRASFQSCSSRSDGTPGGGRAVADPDRRGALTHGRMTSDQVSVSELPP